MDSVKQELTCLGEGKPGLKLKLNRNQASTVSDCETCSSGVVGARMGSKFNKLRLAEMLCACPTKGARLSMKHQRVIKLEA